MKITRMQLRRLIESALYENKNKVTPETIRGVLENNFSNFSMASAPINLGGAQGNGTFFQINIDPRDPNRDGAEAENKEKLKREFKRVINILEEFKRKNNSSFEIYPFGPTAVHAGLTQEFKDYLLFPPERITFQGGSAAVKEFGKDIKVGQAASAKEGLSGLSLKDVMDEDPSYIEDNILFVIKFK